jgi:hypothetical protein
MTLRIVSKQGFRRRPRRGTCSCPRPVPLARTFALAESREAVAMLARVRPSRKLALVRGAWCRHCALRDKLPFPVHSKVILTRDGVVLSFVPSFHSIQPCELL